MARTLFELDTVVAELERLVEELRQPPQIIYKGHGITFAGSWDNNTTQPFIGYLWADGRAHITARLATPNNSGQTTVTTLPVNYRPREALRAPVTVSSTTGIDLTEIYAEIQNTGNIVVDNDVAALASGVVYLNFAYNTRYPGVK